MENNDIINELELFLVGETLEECPINIVSREDIEGETAELVWFEWGEEKHKCPAIVWASGYVFTTIDWQISYNENEFRIEDFQWMDCNFKLCVMFMGLPRLLC